MELFFHLPKPGKRSKFNKVYFGNARSKGIKVDNEIDGRACYVHKDNIPYLNEVDLYFFRYDKEQFFAAKKDGKLYEVNVTQSFGDKGDWYYANPKLALMRDMYKAGATPFDILAMLEI